MEANTLSFYHSLGREPPAWALLPPAAQFISAAAAALRAGGDGETHPLGRQSSGDRSLPPGTRQAEQLPRAARSAPAAGSGSHGEPDAGTAAPSHPRSRLAGYSQASSDDSGEEDHDGPCWVTKEHIEAISEGLAILEARSDPAAPARHGVPLEWGTRTTVLGLVDPNPGGMRSWVLGRAVARPPRAHEVWVRHPGAPFAPCGPYGSMAGGVPLPVMAKLIKNLSECANGFEPDDDELPMEETRTVRPPARASPTLPGRPAGDVEYGARPGPGNGPGGAGP